MTPNTFFYGNAPAIPENRICLERPRLYQCFEKALDSTLITVVAGSGYGKSYAVYLFLRRTNLHSVWIQLSKRDNLTARFWENISGTVASLNPDVGAALREQGFPGSQQQFDRYLALVERIMVPGRNYVLVLDDFHLLDSAQVMRFVEWHAASPLFNFRTIVISRTRPPLDLISLDAKGLVSEITADDLRFSEEEIDEYYKLQNIVMPPGELKQLYHDTEGWAMALGVIAQNIRNHGGRPVYSSSGTEMAAFEKIEENHFSEMPEDLRKFLIKLSLIEHWPRELLEKIAAGKKLIDAMENISPFIRYDAYRNSYLIHHLFREFLKKKKDELSEAEMREIYNASAEWCVKNNQLMDAALDYERARNYHGFRLLIDSLPLKIADQMTEFLLKILDRLLSDAEPVSRDSIEDLLVLRHKARPKFLLALGRLDESAACSREAIAQFENLPPGPVRSWILANAYINLGIVAILSSMVTKHYNFAPYFEKSLEYAVAFPQSALNIKIPRIHGSVYSYICRVGYPAQKGEFEKFINAFAPAASLAGAIVDGFFCGLDILARAEVAYYRGDLLNAETFALQSVYKARQKKQHETESGGLFYLLRLGLHAGDAAKIREVLRQMEAQLGIREYFNRFVIYDINTGWFHAHTGLLSLQSEGGPFSEFKSDYTFDNLNAIFYSAQKALVKAKNFYALRQYSAALRVLDDFDEKKNEIGDFVLARIDRAVLRAVCLCRRDTAENAGPADAGPEEALRALEEAYEMAAPNSLDMPFIEHGKDMQFLTGIALGCRSCSIPRPWLEMIRNKASIYGKNLLLALEQQEAPDPEQMPYLSWREKEVLRAISRGWNRERIAESLAMSVNTVKAEISSVYAKLGAQNRADAVRIAAKLKIF